MLDYIIGGSLVGLMGLILLNNKEYDRKVSRVYERLDEVKKDNENKFTSKDVCSIRHEQITADLKEIKQDIKKLLQNNGK